MIGLESLNGWIGHGPQASRRRLCFFCAVVAGFWVLAMMPAYLIAGGWGVLGSGIAALLCLLPGLLVLSLADRLRQKDSLPLLAVGGMLLRLVVVLGAGAGLYATVDVLGVSALVVWLVFFYFLTLLLETVLIAASFSTDQSSPTNG